MGLFNRLFGSKATAEIQDDFFGPLSRVVHTDIYGKSTVMNRLKGRAVFDEVEIRVELICGIDGPNQTQKDFFQELNDRFQVMKSNELIPLLNEELVKWTEEFPVDVNFDEDFVVYTMELPDCRDKPVRWKLVLYHTQLQQFFTVHFTDFTANQEIEPEH